MIHLAAVPDDADFHQHLLPTNIGGTYNVVEAVRRSISVKRFIVASSGKMYSGYTGPTPITIATSAEPTCYYSCTKLFSEAAAKSLANSEAGKLAR